MTDAIPWIDDTVFPTLSPQLQDAYKKFAFALEREEASDIATQLTTLFQQQPQRLQEFHKVLACSPFVTDSCCRDPAMLVQLLTGDALEHSFSQQEIQQQINAASPADEAQLLHQLRRVRRLSMCHIIWRDFNRLADLEQTTGELSDLAKASLHAALAFHYPVLVEKFGTPRNSQGIAQPMLILGMGKLGADELNLSSDIDLIFCFPEAGQTDGSKSTSNQEFFIELGKKIIQSLDNVTADGFVFRVDMRLRPYGQSGALVSNFDALEEYYQSQGREWERYAMVKARVVAHNGEVCPSQFTAYQAELNQTLRSFTFRKYIDFSVIEALRNLKQMIVQEVKRRRLTDDIKLGAGGIREIEFITQVFQLIRGGRDQELQDNRLQYVLPTLEHLACLPPGKAEQLKQAYVFLRNCEHAIQGYEDKQTQRLPSDPDAQHALIEVMGFSNWDDFLAALKAQRQFVSEEFASVIALPSEKSDAAKSDNPWISLWQGNQEKDSCLSQLTKAGHQDSNLSLACLEELRQQADRFKLHANSRERLDKFMPQLLAILANREDASQTLQRLAQLVKAIMRRSAYLLLLLENPGALNQLVQLAAHSPWVAEQLAMHPALLDELLDPRTLYQPPDQRELEDELRRTVLRLAPEDLEAQMEALRYFRSAHALRVAASELTDALPLMKVSDYLTWIAEVILTYVLQLSWDEMTRKYGYPDGLESDHPQFIIIGYGKLGGIELGHGSDLDLVFLHNADINGETNGAKAIENQRFFMMLGQKIIHFLSTNTVSGRLYEVDMRLRPSGNAGMLVTTLNGFAKYQESTAWTWEHQALVRARPVAGDPELAQQFEEIRKAVLCGEREPTKLQQEVVDMRLKMRDHLGSEKKHRGEAVFDLKHDAGGIVDIEFMVQYGVLAWSHADPTLVQFTDNIRILECMLQSGRLEAQEVHQLIEAYKAYRSLGHKLTLQQQAGLVDPEQCSSERTTVTRIWNRLFT
ncbi:Bifunctional glutamine synthetase adenylyltransferase/adenylyl-removing enzyme [Thalassocella blandensis]|nr:Bifunctional glutamine synthetase adenylyltransferase/adenylyl-removing enzyme [Thalassocella blandensis]